jgi:hypothetical protein
MAKLIYVTPASVDGYIADDGNFDWAAPDEEAFAFIKISSAPSACISMDARCTRRWRFGRRQTSIPGRTPAMLDFARIWQAADKIVYSKSLETVSTPKTRLEREFDPQAVRDLKVQLPHDVSVSGPTLAAHAIRTGLVDEYHLRRAYYAWRRQADPTQQRMHKAGSPGRAPFC